MLSLPSTSSEELEDFHCKIVLVGDCKCGKTALIHQFVNEEFLQVYAPTIFERYSVTYQVTNYRVHCTIWDTSGTPGYDTVRPLAYPETHVFILCFTISDPTTLENIVTKWYPEVRRYCQTTPLILCGCQSDLRNDCETLSKLAEIQRIPVSAEQADRHRRDDDDRKSRRDEDRYHRSKAQKRSRSDSRSRHRRHRSSEEREIDIEAETRRMNEIQANIERQRQRDRGVAVSRQIGATTYVETSSKTCPKAIQDAFEVSALAALGKLNKSLSSNQKFSSNRYNGTWHRAKVDLNFRDRTKNCVVM